jgi:predicted DNA-binding antitoxin AbrB/MazE fold protein
MSADTFTVEAVFENGVLRPLEPMPLTDGQRVTITIQLPDSRLAEPAPDHEEWERQE